MVIWYFLKDQEVISEVISATYSIALDDETLRNSPETFEFQRGNYPIRREFQNYSMQLNDCNSEVVNTLVKMGFKKGRMLDVGSAFGYMLNLAHKMGNEVLGVEPSQSARDFALEKFGVESVSHISDISDSLTFDIILCMETLYYLHDIRQTLYEVRKNYPQMAV